MEVSMHLDTAGIVGIQAAYASTVPVLFVFRPGKLGGPDAGEWTGSMIVTDMNVSGQVDENWSVALSGQITGAVLYTAPV